MNKNNESTAEEQNLISQDMIIQEILTRFPGKSEMLAQEMVNEGLHCVGCGASTFETLAAGMLGHGKTPKEVSSLVERLNAVLKEPVELDKISITERAAAHFLKVLDDQGKQGWSLRIFEAPGQCGDFQYELDFSEKADLDKDMVFSTEFGFDIHVMKTQLQRLLGSRIDYIEGGLTGSGFKVSNPNVSSSCGCGATHSYKQS